MRLHVLHLFQCLSFSMFSSSCFCFDQSPGPTPTDSRTHHTPTMSFFSVILWLYSFPFLPRTNPAVLALTLSALWSTRVMTSCSSTWAPAWPLCTSPASHTAQTPSFMRSGSVGTNSTNKCSPTSNNMLSNVSNLYLLRTLCINHCALVPCLI